MVLNRTVHVFAPLLWLWLLLLLLALVEVPKVLLEALPHPLVLALVLVVVGPPKRDPAVVVVDVDVLLGGA